MDSSALEGIPITRVHAALAPEGPWRWPPMPGVTVRGALGRVVYRAVCEFPGHVDCGACPRLESCAVPGWFDPGRGGGRVVRPFALRVWGDDVLYVGLTFLGSVPAPDLVLGALAAMAADGLGRERVPFHLGPVAVHGATTELWLPEARACWPAPADLASVADEPPPGPLVLRLLTPFRPSKDRPVALDLQQVWRAALFRLRSVRFSLGLLQAPRLQAPALDAVLVDRGVQVVQAGRRSGRQGHRLIDLSGFVGEVALDGELGDLPVLLAAGEILQVGRGTSAGLGVIGLDRPEG